MLQLPQLNDVLAARERIRPHVHRTPLLSSRFLGAVHGASVFLKAENLQRSGSFKIRGALNALLKAREEGKIGAAGVLTYSSGNHGQAVGLAARLVGCHAAVVAPEDIAPVKLSALEEYGVKVFLRGLTSEERFEAATALARETGALLIPPYDHPDVIAGQGTLGLEILEDLPDVDAVLVPVGGGGLIAGVSLAIKTRSPRVRIVGVEPAEANDMALSLAAGRKVKIDPPRTIADGLRALTPGDLTFEAARRWVDEIWCVEDDATIHAQRRLLERAKLLVEPSGAAVAAAFLVHGKALAGTKVILVLSGGNTELPGSAGAP